MIKRFFILLAGIICISGCASVRYVVPEEKMLNASVSGMRDIRAFGGIPSAVFQSDVVSLLKKNTGNNPFSIFYSNQNNYVLAISGGGAYGAYGAGLLNGWSAAGTRPEFKVVTGVSTGAIIAPFAFLGSEYDGQLREFYTKHSTRDVFRMVFPFKNALSKTWPLKKLIDKYFDEKLLKAVAKEYAAGRRLYVGTTNLDAQRLVIWDMGKIASYGGEEGLKLFREVILASSSIPIAFPPVYIHVAADNKVYDEMHVDGGVVKQVFFLYDVLQGIEKLAKDNGTDITRGKYVIYVIRNGYADPAWKEVPDSLMSIAERAVDTMVNSQSLGDIYQLYTFTKLGKGDFNLAYIPATHKYNAKEMFDPKEMNDLFDLGFGEAVRGYEWKKIPPGLEQQ